MRLAGNIPGNQIQYSMKIKNKKNTIFLTGATGLVGSYLLKILLQHGHKVYCLARSKADKNARQRVVNILNFWDKKTVRNQGQKLIVVKGDIAQKNLGLSRKDSDKLKQETEEIFHSAAVTDINWPLEKICKVNVEGTKKVLDFALKCNKLSKVNHISTTYVCGDHKMIFTEKNLDARQKFNTTYEQSKFEAEKLAHRYRKKGLWIDIFRPSLVIGESTTGKINQFKNIYQFLKLCELELFKTLPIKNGHVSTVFIDDCAKALYVLSQKCMKHNLTYNIFPNTRVSLRKIVLSFCRFRHRKMPRIIPITDFDSNLLTPAQREILKRNILALNTSVKFVSAFTEKTLKGYGFKYTRLNNSNLLKLINYSRKKRDINGVT